MGQPQSKASKPPEDDLVIGDPVNYRLHHSVVTSFQHPSRKNLNDIHLSRNSMKMTKKF